MDMTALKERMGGFDTTVLAGLRDRAEENARAWSAPENTAESDEALLNEMSMEASMPTPLSIRSFADIVSGWIVNCRDADMRAELVKAENALIAAAVCVENKNE